MFWCHSILPGSYTYGRSVIDQACCFLNYGSPKSSCDFSHDSFPKTCHYHLANAVGDQSLFMNTTTNATRHFNFRFSLISNITTRRTAANASWKSLTLFRWLHGILGWFLKAQTHVSLHVTSKRHEHEGQICLSENCRNQRFAYPYDSILSSS